MDYSYMSSTKVVFTVCIVYQTIYRINYLFQNGRLLLTCIILLSPTSGNPDVFDITRSPALIPVNDTSVGSIVNKHFKTVFLRFRTSVLLLTRSSSHSYAVIFSSFSRLFTSENSTELSSSNSSLAPFQVLCCCRVALQPQFA